MTVQYNQILENQRVEQGSTGGKRSFLATSVNSATSSPIPPRRDSSCATRDLIPLDPKQPIRTLGSGASQRVLQGEGVCTSIVSMLGVENVNYWDGISKPISYMKASMVPGGEEQSFALNPRRCQMWDMRVLAKQTHLSLEEHGFMLVHHTTTMAYDDFHDPDLLTSRYYREMEALVLSSVPGATRVLIFDHNVRIAGEELFDSAEREQKRVDQAHAIVPTGPVLFPHNDYTDRSGPMRLLALTNPRGEGGSYTRDAPLLSREEAKNALETRFAIVQVWRPIHHPVMDCPLAVCDGRSLVEGDLVETPLVYPDRHGYTYLLAPGRSSQHRWYYPSRMTREEAMVFKVYDSRRDAPVRFTAHSAVQLQDVAPSTPKRESCEIRALVFFDVPHEGRKGAKSAEDWPGGGGSKRLGREEESKRARGRPLGSVGGLPKL